MTWDEIGRNVGDRIFELEQQIEDMKEASYDASFVAMGSYNTGGDGESPEGVTGSTNVLRGAVTLTPTLCRRIDSEPMVEGGSNVSDTIQVLNPYQIVKPKGTENPINIKWLDKASHDGQILILEPFYKHPTADNSSNTTAYSLVLKTAGNINISSDITVASGGKVFLQWTENVPITNSSSGSWTIISQSSGGSGVSLSGTNTWTGTNTFSGGFSTAGTTTSLTSPNIYLGDQSTDAITISGGITSTGTNVWSGINTFSGNVSITGSTITLGDSATDVINMYGKVNSDLNMGTFDIKTLDRLLFDVNGSDAIGSSDYGIGAEASGGTTLGLVYSTPASKTHKFNIGGTPELTISNSYISASTKRITNVVDPTGAQDVATKNYVDNNSGSFSGDLNGNDLTECTGIDLDGASATIQGITTLDFYQTANSITSLSSGMSYQTASGDTHDFIIGGVNELSLSGSGIDMQGNEITDLGDITFTAGQSIDSSSGGLTISSPTNDNILLFADGEMKMNFAVNDTIYVYDPFYMGGNKITSLGTPTATTDAVNKAYCDSNSGGGGANTDLSNLTSTGEAKFAKLSSHNTWSGNQTFNGVFQTKTTTKLGDSSSDDIQVQGKLNFVNNFTTSFLATHPSVSGYITIKTSGGDKNIWVS